MCRECLLYLSVWINCIVGLIHYFSVWWCKMSVRTKSCFLGLNQTKETVTWSGERTHGSKWARISAQPHVFKEHKRKKTKNKENVSPCCFKQNLVNSNSLNNPPVCLLLLLFFFTTPGSLKMFWLLHFQSFSEYSRLVFSGDRIGPEYDRFIEKSVSDSATNLLLFPTSWMKIGCLSQTEK